jgi:hypothetical protein
MPYLADHNFTLGQRHYITHARSQTNFFNFYEGKLRDYIHSHGTNFCLVIDCSTAFDSAYILPFEEFRDFFTQDLLDSSHRWVGNVRNEYIRISANGLAQERSVGQYLNAFHLLQDAPAPIPKEVEFE